MTRNEYDLNPKLCLHCGTAIPFEKRANKFCNSSCSATFNNTGKKHSEEHKAAIAASVNAYNALIGKVAKPKPRLRLLKLKNKKSKLRSPHATRMRWSTKKKILI